MFCQVKSGLGVLTMQRTRIDNRCSTEWSVMINIMTIMTENTDTDSIVGIVLRNLRIVYLISLIDSRFHRLSTAVSDQLEL